MSIDLPLFGVDWKDKKLRDERGKPVRPLEDVAKADGVVSPDKVLQAARDKQLEMLSS